MWRGWCLLWPPIAQRDMEVGQISGAESIAEHPEITTSTVRVFMHGKPIFVTSSENDLGPGRVVEWSSGRTAAWQSSNTLIPQSGHTNHGKRSKRKVWLLIHLMSRPAFITKIRRRTDGALGELLESSKTVCS